MMNRQSLRYETSPRPPTTFSDVIKIKFAYDDRSYVNTLRKCFKQPSLSQTTSSSTRLPRFNTRAFSSSPSTDSSTKHTSKRSKYFKDAPSLKEFLNTSESTSSTYSGLPVENVSWKSKYGSLNFYIETYGCQMNVADSDIVRSILTSAGHVVVNSAIDAHIIFTNTCAIRENPEKKVLSRLSNYQSLRQRNYLNLPKSAKSNIKYGNSKDFVVPLIGVLGCMAERLKEKLIEEKSVDIVCGPDAYRDLPRLIDVAISNAVHYGSPLAPTFMRARNVDVLASNTQLSLDETYADIKPIREGALAHSAFVSIMRGCNNMCSFCIVPFTRGRERSRPIDSILEEIKDAINSPVPIREITLLGQNVNGYHDTSPEGAEKYPGRPYEATEGFDNLYKSKKKNLPGPRFRDLLEAISDLDPELRIRFQSPHPKDFPEGVIDLIASRPNICSSIHLPVQSGSTSTLERMRRGYTREAFLALVKKCREKIPDVCISTDVIAGFCDETEEEHLDTVSLMKEVEFDHAFMFEYSLRDKTHAAHTMEDNISPAIKSRRLREIIDVYHKTSYDHNVRKELGKYQLVLVEGESLKSDKRLSTGRTDGNKRTFFRLETSQLIYNSMADYLSANIPKISVPIDNSLENADDMYYEEFQSKLSNSSELKKSITCVSDPKSLYGTYLVVKIVKCNGATLRGVVIARSSITEFATHKNVNN